MKRHVVIAALAACLAGHASAQVTAPYPDKIAYTVLKGQTNELHIADETGLHDYVVFKSPSSIVFDLAPRSQRQIAVWTAGVVRLLTLGSNSLGQYVVTDNQVIASSRNSMVEFSPNGSQIAYRGNNGVELMVYTIADHSTVQWGTASTYVWDIAWRTGGGIAYVDPSPSPGTSPDRLWEVSAPGATPIALFEAPHIEAAKPSRQSADLILTYRPVWGMSDRIALWSNGSIVNDNITGALANQPADWATLNCADTRFVYMTAGSGKQGVWHIFNLQTNQDTLFLKATGLRQTQYFPTC